MVEKIGKDSALAREALRAAQRFASERAGSMGAGPAAMGSLVGTQPVTSSPSASSVDFGAALDSGIQQVNQKVLDADSMPLDLLSGKVNDFHEIAVQLKDAELSFKFAMEIRNKLVDAYREIMRMSV
ncbi:MAG: flagellar hook-basal body complex protein FliE [Planctomycetes bacterium]|nr:flagellar hook-basal body complex protein FliE [Planctomycetota bacterium]